MTNLVEDLKQRAFYLRRCYLGRDVWVRSRRKCKTRLVGTGDGAWTLCTERLNDKSVVYSLGLGWDISFDLDLIRQFGCQVFGFEPDPKVLAWLDGQTLPAGFRCFPFGIAGEPGRFTFRHPLQSCATLLEGVAAPGEGEFTAEVRTLGSVVGELGHETIDVLKIDIEGAEFGLVDAVCEHSSQIRQLLIEWHHRLIAGGEPMLRKSLGKLSDAGFEVFYVSPRGFEHGYLNRNLV